MNRQYINRKNLIFVALVAICLLILQYFFTHTKVTIENDGETKTVYIKKGFAEENLYEFSLGPNEKKQFTLRAGEYKIGASAEDRLSIYRKDFKGLSSNNVQLKTLPQKQAVLLGQDENNCVKTLAKEKFVYYPCSNYSGNVNVGPTTEGSSLEISPFAEQVFSHDHGGDEVSAEAENTSTTSMVLSPYGGGFLELASKDNELLFRSVNNVGQSLAEKPSSKIGSFKGPLNSVVVSSAKDQKNTAFSVLDRGKGELIIFSNSSDVSPSKVDLSGELGEDIDTAAKLVLVSGNYAFVAFSRDPGELDEHSDEGGSSGDSPDKIATKIIVVDLAKKSVHKVHKLPDTVLPSSLSVSPSSGSFLYAPIDQVKNPTLLITPDDVSEANLPSNEIKEACWGSDNEIYYITSGRGQIYLYQFDSQASFLVYDNHEDTVSNLRCSFGEVTFTLGSLDDGVTDGFVHYKLTDEAHTKLRAESILPLYVDVGKDVIKVSIETGGYTIKLLQDGDKNGPPDKEAAKIAALQKMSDAGIDTKSISFVFNY